jgi:hypothetical protein
MGEPVEQGAGEAFGAEDLGPFLPPYGRRPVRRDPVWKGRFEVIMVEPRS